ncbi:MAG TPA: serine hydrolase [Caulobacteraceae bacterium]|nr:serine hydrolase [Caulobacteraceae bacterium]
MHRRAVIAGAAALAACSRPTPILPPMKGVLDRNRLDREGAALAARAAPGVLGAGVFVTSDEAGWFLNGDARFQMAGLAVLPLAILALTQVDSGALKFNERVRIEDVDLSPPPSAIDRLWPNPPDGHAAALPVADLIALAVQRGDRTAADVLMRQVGGPGAVTGWLQAKGIAGMRVDRYFREIAQNAAGMIPFQPGWKDEGAWLAARESVPPELREKAIDAFLADPRDTSTPRAMALLLDRLAIGELLSARSGAWLLRLMRATIGRFDALSNGLPKGSSFAHISDEMGTDLGRTPAAGDAGIATLPGGARLVLVTFIAASTSTEAARNRLMADFAREAVGALS